MPVDPSASLRRRRVLRALLSLAAWLCLFPAASAQYSDRDRELDLAAFDQVWQTVLEKHWDPEFGGVDWEGAREELRPKVAAASSRAEAREVMSELLSRLGKSHFGIVPGSAAELLEEPDDLEPASEGGAAREGGEAASGDEKEVLSGRMAAPPGRIGGPGVSGLTIRVVDGSALVTAVREDTPAAEQGIRPGWEVLRIGSKDVGERIAKLNESLPDSSMNRLIVNRSIAAQLDRSAGRKLDVTFRTGANEEREVSFETIPHPDKAVRFGNMPEMRVAFEARELAGGVGYVRITSFFDVVYLVKGFQQAIEDFQNAPGLVIDLRGNPGGVGALAMALAGFLIGDEEKRLGTMSTRDSELHFAFNPREITYDGPVAVLVDEDSASTTEIFAGGLQDLGRARIFGRRTAGAALPSIFVNLPNGDQLQYAIANYVSVSGKVLEGEGVVPDETVIPTRERLLSEGDPILAAALRWIQEQAKGSR